MHYRDVIIHANSGIFGHEDELERWPPISFWPQQKSQKLSDEIWIGRVDADIAKTVMDTCEKKTLGVMSPVRQFAQLYSFVRELPSDTDIYGWDADNILTGTIAISRLTHPTSTGFTYAARIAYDDSGLRQVFPADIKGISADVFFSPNRTRDWLTEQDAQTLRELVPQLGSPLSPRIHNALWHHEYAARTYYLDHRWTLVCTGLEALVHTDKERNTAQFTRRVSRLASEFGISISEAEATDAYDLRSRLAHGVSFISTAKNAPPNALQIQLYDSLEDTLRLAVLEGMRNRTFADILQEDDRIRKRWPI